MLLSQKVHVYIKISNLFKLMNNAMQVSTVYDNRNSYLPHSVTMSLMLYCTIAI